MLIDEAEITLKGGHGGAGKVSFFPGEKSGPDGGNGGRGGDVYISTTSDLTALNRFTRDKTLIAEKGGDGGGNRKFGSDGQDMEIKMPIGTYFLDKKTGEEFELKNTEDKILIAKGGLGGRGNAEFKSPRRTTPMYAQPGLSGQERELKVILKLIADFGLIGLPNSGKSSLLNELTAASAKVANYPFTTLEPNLGVLDGRVIADIPGLIEGASAGKGLGIKFLKHIEKVGLLLYTVSLESDDPVRDYQTVRNELEKYNPELLEKKEIILLTKSDLLDKKDLENKLKLMKKFKKEIFPISIHDWDSISKLKEHITP